MQRALTFGRWILAKAISLLCGIFVGAALAVAIVEGGPDAWTRSLPILEPTPPAFNDYWMLEIEWKVALAYGCLIATIASVFWALLTWRRYNHSRSAMILGFTLSGVIGAWGFADGNSNRATAFLAFGLAGALAGLVIFSVDTILLRRLNVGRRSRADLI